MAGRGVLGAMVRSSLRAVRRPHTPFQLLTCGYAKKAVMKGKGKGVAKEVLKGPDVCKDPVLLTTHAMGVNIYKEGQEVVLKEDSAYPEWLFKIDLGPPKKLEELDPESSQYWRTMRKLHIWRNNKLSKDKKF
ncbi:large ribosomal subunit protein mL54 [Microcaecilia unicolor]|uniref:Large ribosomal subunit protein mL54 n=1 Tax=Microcaecilia unicolor TaxID=1415580 RepID=A0A6P7ZCD8_9AMPH|nr:39S ribosomal protein L54, mitochondrial [Microcaecilia unicolor]